MNNNRFKYWGLERKGFVFIDTNNKRITFNKCRKELIEDFQLEDESYVNDWFFISYFETKPLNQHDLTGNILIISDMKLIK